MSDFYVYIYLDTRKSGKFIYGDLEFQYEPIYVGKGRGDRYKRHFQFYNLYKSHFYSKLKNILEERFEPLILKKYENLTEKESFKKEKELIEIIGRKSKGGPLTNQSDGGEGQSGFIHNEETKNKISESLKNNKEFQDYMKSEEFRKKVSDGLKGHEGYGKGIPRTEEVKRKISDKQSFVYTIRCPNGEIIKLKNLKNVKDYFREINKHHTKTSKKRVSPDAILFGSGSKGYILISKKLEEI